MQCILIAVHDFMCVCIYIYIHTCICIRYGMWPNLDPLCTGMWVQPTGQPVESAELPTTKRPSALATA